MGDASSVFVPALAALPVIEARIEAGAAVLAVAGFSAKGGDTTPEEGRVVDFGEDGESDYATVAAAVGEWPTAPGHFVEIVFAGS